MAPLYAEHSNPNSKLKGDCERNTMHRNRSKRVTAILASAVLGASACTHSTRVSMEGPSVSGKGREEKKADVRKDAKDPWAPLRKTLKGQPGVRPRVDGYTLEQEYPELASAIAEVKAHPQNGARRLKLGTLYHQLGLYDEASVEYHKALEREPKNAQVHERLGKLWLDWGDSARALGAVE